MSPRLLILGIAILLSTFCLPAPAEQSAATAKTSTPSEKAEPVETSEPVEISMPAETSEPAVKSEALPVKYVGNSESHKFHRPSCPYARIMAHSKRMQFYFRRQAVACGHVPCRYCLPQRWTFVRARLLTPLTDDKDRPPDASAAPP